MNRPDTEQANGVAGFNAADDQQSLPAVQGDDSASDSAGRLPSDWLDSDRGVRRFGYGVVMALVLVGFVWGGLAPLESAALAPGVVQVEGRRKAVQHLEGGRVSEILVANGDWVAADQPLIGLDATKDRAEEQILQGRFYNARALVDRLIAERDDVEVVVFAPALLNVVDSDVRAASAIASESALFEARLVDRTGEASVLQQRIDQYREKIAGLQSVLLSRNEVAESLASEIADLEALLADGYVDKQRLRELERSRTQTLGEISDLQAQIATARVAIGETELQIIQLNKRFKTEVVAELTEAQEQFYDVEQQLLATSDRVRRATIRAAVDGVVLNLVVNTIGAVIRPGDTLMELVPQTDALVIEAQVSPMDIDRLVVGQDAEIRFSVFKDAYLVSGKLTKLSPDSLVNEETGVPYYAAEVSILDEDRHFLEGLTLVPGMPAEVLIKTGTRTMLDYVTSPLSRGFSRALIED